jgi:hypothetical protein
MTATSGSKPIRAPPAAALSVGDCGRKLGIAKKAVSFSKSYKYHSTCISTGTRDNTQHGDANLQSMEQKRRYHRRGSKTPAMLLLSKEDIALIWEGNSAASCFEPSSPGRRRESAVLVPRRSRCSDPAAPPEHHHQQPQRRKSLISALRENFEKSCVLVSEPRVANTIRRLSFTQQRRSTLELLSRPVLTP